MPAKKSRYHGVADASSVVSLITTGGTIPEPSTYAVVVGGLAALLVVFRRKRNG